MPAEADPAAKTRPQTASATYSPRPVQLLHRPFELITMDTTVIIVITILYCADKVACWQAFKGEN
jgi:predicted homoserine dehydrogenase-like protein